MSPKTTTYHRPTDLTAALQLLAQPDTVALGGGTKLLTATAPAAVVDLQDLGLNQIDAQPDRLHLGAMVRLQALRDFLADDGADPAPLLRRAVQQAGPNTYRNAATLGGTIASRLSDSELLAALLVLEATVHMQPDTTLPLADYLAAPTKPAGLITAVSIPWQPGKGDSARVARTPADSPIVSITGWLPQNGTIRLAATGSSERPYRLTAAEAAVATGLTDQTIPAAAQAARAAANHPGDFRGDAAYRADMAAVLTQRVLNQLQS